MSIKRLIAIWNGWDPQLTWQEVVRLTGIETAICIEFIGLFELIS